jgi:UDP-N-acetylmuramoyl-tripeptide--D-alanyl-D-alanine ligase
MMRSFSLAEAIQWLQPDCRFDGPDNLTFNAVNTDTRSLLPGQLFVALRGEKFDGHRFLQKAQEQGASAAVVDCIDAAVDLPQLLVSDTLIALGQLATGHRATSNAALIAITGSSGKTTVREMTGAILQQMGPALITQGNLNNHIGVPLTLFGLAPEHRFGAIELGASGLKEIAYIVAMVKPQVVILTNAGQAHLEGFGSYQNIVLAKGEIIDGVADDGLVVLNRDDPAFDQWLARAGRRRVASVSRAGHPIADYKATAVAGGLLQISGPGGWLCEVRLGLEGEHNFSNATMAAAAARELGATDEHIKAGLEQVLAVKGRLHIQALAQGWTLIDDSYNANPASIKAALSVLAKRPSPRIAVLGAMAELGEQAARLHQEVGQYARDLGIERLVTVGASCEGYHKGFGSTVEICVSHNQAIDAVLKNTQVPATVLVKGSRSSAMEIVAEGIKNKVNGTCCSG